MTAPDRDRYAERAEARRQRLEERAQRAAGEAATHDRRFRQVADMIPLGQPILVGHHSERRHRRDLERMDRSMREAARLRDLSRRLRERAAAIDDTSIRVENPDAPRLLQERVADLDAEAELSKAANEALRIAKIEHLRANGPTPDGTVTAQHLALIDKVAAQLELPDRMVRGLQSSARAFPWLPQINLALIRANATRLRKRLAQIQAVHDRPPAEPVTGVGCELTEDHDLVRLVLRFERRPVQEITRACRAAGFHWSRTEGAWLRQLNPGARRRAETLLEEIARLSPRPQTSEDSCDKPNL